jgi:hypothetical protein
VYGQRCSAQTNVRVAVSLASGANPFVKCVAECEKVSNIGCCEYDLMTSMCFGFDTGESHSGITTSTSMARASASCIKGPRGRPTDPPETTTTASVQTTSSPRVVQDDASDTGMGDNKQKNPLNAFTSSSVMQTYTLLGLLLVLSVLAVALALCRVSLASKVKTRHSPKTIKRLSSDDTCDDEDAGAPWAGRGAQGDGLHVRLQHFEHVTSGEYLAGVGNDDDAGSQFSQVEWDDACDTARHHKPPIKDVDVELGDDVELSEPRGFHQFSDKLISGCMNLQEDKIPSHFDQHAEDEETTDDSPPAQSRANPTPYASNDDPVSSTATRPLLVLTNVTNASDDAQEDRLGHGMLQLGESPEEDDAIRASAEVSSLELLGSVGERSATRESPNGRVQPTLGDIEEEADYRIEEESDRGSSSSSELDDNNVTADKDYLGRDGEGLLVAEDSRGDEGATEYDNMSSVDEYIASRIDEASRVDDAENDVLTVSSRLPPMATTPHAPSRRIKHSESSDEDGDEGVDGHLSEADREQAASTTGSTIGEHVEATEGTNHAAVSVADAPPGKTSPQQVEYVMAASWARAETDYQVLKDDESRRRSRATVEIRH